MALLSQTALQSHCQCSIFPRSSHNGLIGNFPDVIAGQKPIHVKLVSLPVRRLRPALVPHKSRPLFSAGVDLTSGRRPSFHYPQNGTSVFSGFQRRAQAPFSYDEGVSESSVAFKARATTGRQKRSTNSRFLCKKTIFGACLRNRNTWSLGSSFDTHSCPSFPSIAKPSSSVSPSGVPFRRVTGRIGHHSPRFGGVSFGTPCCRKSGRRRGARALGGGAAESLFALAGGVEHVESVIALARGAVGGESVVTVGGSMGNIGSVFTLAAQGPPAVDLQTVIIGGGAFLSIFASLYFGMKGEPVACKACGGNGGTKCIFCENGKMRSDKGLVDCRVCRGAGLVLCRTCRGSGFSTRM